MKYLLGLFFIACSNLFSQSIGISNAPRFNSQDDISGFVGTNITPANYNVIVYIYVPSGGGWWIKPYSNSPYTGIGTNRTWTCDITTGGVDSQATEVRAFLTPKGVYPNQDSTSYPVMMYNRQYGFSCSLDPQTVTTLAGATISYSALTTGSPSLQWYKGTTAIAGATSNSYSFITQADSTGTYSLKATKSGVTLNLAAGTVSVITSNPVITATTQNQTVNSGAFVTFTTTVSGATGLQWLFNGRPIDGAIYNACYVSSAKQINQGLYSLQATNLFGVVTKDIGTLTVLERPSFTVAQQNQSVTLGGTASFTATVSGSPVPTLQWYKDGVAILGATNTTLSFKTQPTSAGKYTITATNSSGATTQEIGVLTVPYSSLVNLSTRGYIPVGGALSLGVVLSGDNTKKPVLFRAIGPTLRGFGISNPVTDPKLALYDQVTQANISNNDDWTSSLAPLFTRLGAFSLGTSSKDAATSIDLSPNLSGYTMRITASNAGTVIGEIYDADSNNLNTRLVNLSSLCYVGTGEQVLVLGFVITGTAEKNLLIRAIGPGLRNKGVDNVLNDPHLDVYSGSTLLASNNNWGGVRASKDAFGQAGAFPLEDTSLDAVVLVRLSAGVYSAVVSGVNDTTGQALLEIYEF